jgi:arylsulfatase
MMPSRAEPGAETSRRYFLKTGAGGACVAFTSALPPGQPKAKGQPHILLLMAVQFRGDCLGAEGHPAVRTPNLDRIAAEGVRFRCAYSSVPACTPARAGLLTGLSPWRRGMLGYDILEAE